MAIALHIHRLLCRHCRHSKPLKCAHKGKKRCQTTGGEDPAAATPPSSAEHHPQTTPMSPLHTVRYNDRAARRALRRAKADLERELAKFPAEDDDDDDYANDDEQVHRWQVEQAVLDDERMMPLDFLAELSGESHKTDVELDFDFALAQRGGGSAETVELLAVVPAELPTNIHWTDATDSSDSTDSTYSTNSTNSTNLASIGVALTTAGRVRTPPHARPLSLPPAFPPYPPLGKVRASDNLRQLARKSIGSPVRKRQDSLYPRPLLLQSANQVQVQVQRESLYTLDTAASSSTTSISSTLSVGTAEVLCMTPSVPTLVTIKPACHRPSPRLVNGSSAVPPCLTIGRHPSYRDSAARAHAVPTRQSLPPTLPPTHPSQITPAWGPRPLVLPSLTTPENPPTGNRKRYSDLGQYTRPRPITPTTPLPAPIRPEPRSWARYAQQETDRKEREAASVDGHAPTPPMLGMMPMQPPMPRLRRSPTAVAYSPSAGAAAQHFFLSASPFSPAARQTSFPMTAFDSLEGRELLHSLRLSLGISAAWSPAQTLVFVLEHARTRALAVSHGADTLQRINVLSWAGVLRCIRGQQACERVARWLCSREALFTNKTSVRMLLQRKAKKRVYVENDSGASSSSSSSPKDTTDSICLPTMLSQWAIENNPRRRYHQGWTGAGRSRLSTCMLAE